MKGIIIAVPEKYQNICYKNILKLRNEFLVNLPIEIWQIGNEITKDYMQLFNEIPNIHFKYVEKYAKFPNHWKGFQVKAFILKHTSFDEIILCDADIIFHKDPTIIFEDNNYKETGTYFFRDLEKWKFHNLNMHSSDKFQNLQYFLKRKAFIRQCLPKKSPFFPPEWKYIYDERINKMQMNEAYQEAGCVFLNKNKHMDSVENIFKLNFLHKLTYQYIWGDKETFWIGCLMANKKFYMNNSYSFMCPNTHLLSHNYKGELFFTQK